jgi:hypothetical protein
MTQTAQTSTNTWIIDMTPVSTVSTCRFYFNAPTSVVTIHPLTQRHTQARMIDMKMVLREFNMLE